MSKIIVPIFVQPPLFQCIFLYIYGLHGFVLTLFKKYLLHLQPVITLDVKSRYSNNVITQCFRQLRMS